MPNVEIDGTNSTVKTDKLTSQSGTAITVPTGKVLTVTDAAGLTVAGSTVGALDTAAVATAATAAAQYAIGTQVPPSTSGKVLTSDGTNWTSATPAGGGAWNIIGTAVASNSASLTVTGLDSTYDTYAISLQDLLPANDGRSAKFQVGDSSGIDSGSDDYAYHHSLVNQQSSAYSGNQHSQQPDIRLKKIQKSLHSNFILSGLH